MCCAHSKHQKDFFGCFKVELEFGGCYLECRIENVIPINQIQPSVASFVNQSYKTQAEITL